MSVCTSPLSASPGRVNSTGANSTKPARLEIVALCDVDENRTGKARDSFPKAKFYTDYRKLIDQDKKLDAVLVATPDHNHAIATMAALNAGPARLL